MTDFWSAADFRWTKEGREEQQLTNASHPARHRRHKAPSADEEAPEPGQPVRRVTPPTESHEHRLDGLSSELCDSPRTGSPISDNVSAGSMRPNLGGAIPSATFPTKNGSPGPATGMRQLSLNDRAAASNPQASSRNYDVAAVSAANASKRTAPDSSPSEEPHPRKKGPGSPNLVSTPGLKPQNHPSRAEGLSYMQRGPSRSPQKQTTAVEQAAGQRVPLTSHNQSHLPVKHVTRDSTHYSQSSSVRAVRQGGFPNASASNAMLHPRAIDEFDQASGKNTTPSGNRGSAGARQGVTNRQKAVTPSKTKQPEWQPRMKHSYSGLILQPESSPISEEQLTLEVRGIYSGVVTVEAKCVDIDSALAREVNSPLGVEQWQALIALHRTLLYEHHDFLMATQHPSATPSLRALATKHSMAARMWKHGIHAFLEVLRHRRPESQDYMLAFVVLAYQMMALLYETVPVFTDTWIECLGDLARYRMAIEDDREIHALWGLVAARWYKMASDRHPDIGRLYHHLGILERPSLSKLALYTKSLTCLIPFVNARDSMSTFCKPIIQEEHLSKNNTGSAEAALVTFYALVFTESDAGVIQYNASAASRLLLDQPSAKIKEYGVSLAIVSVSALFEFGSQHNALWQSFSEAISNEKRSARPSEVAMPGSTNKTETSPLTTTSAQHHVIDFYFTCCNALIRPQTSTQSINDLLPSIHVILVWIHSNHSLSLRSNDPHAINTTNPLIDPHRFSWGGLCKSLNQLCREKTIDESIFEAARQGSLPNLRELETFIPLDEDYWIRGLVWGQWYLPKDILPARTDEIDSPQSGEARIRRVQWLALLLAFRIDQLKYDVHQKSFWAPVDGPPVAAQVDRVDSLASTAATQSSTAPSRTTTWSTASSVPTSPSSTSRSSTMFEDGDGFTIVPRPKKNPIRSYANVVASKPKKSRPDIKDVKIADTDEVV